MHLRHVGTTLFALVLSLTAYAQPTPVTVRVLSHDAKFVGSSVGGALVTLTEADSGRVLAQGVTEGETGDTDLIVRTPATDEPPSSPKGQQDSPLSSTSSGRPGSSRPRTARSIFRAPPLPFRPPGCCCPGRI